MKVLNLDNYISEKKSIHPLTIGQIKKIGKKEEKPEMPLDTIIKKIRIAINTYCNYDSYGDDGPIGAGKLLQKYGSECDYCFRAKSVDVCPGNVSESIVIQWVAQERIEPEPFCKMMNEMIELANINLGYYYLYLQATSRSNWDFDNPDYEFTYNEDTGEFESE